jgi:hypothetical protein
MKFIKRKWKVPFLAIFPSRCNKNLGPFLGIDLFDG